MDFKRNVTISLLAFCFILLLPASAWTVEGEGTIFNVRDYGAVGDGKTLDSKAIRATVAACNEAGGGTIYIPTGTYLSGGIELQDNMNIHLDAGAILLANMDSTDYRIRAQIFAEGKQSVSVTGSGTIDGHGDMYVGFPEFRVYPLRFNECQGVTVNDITLREATRWVQHYYKCDDVCIDGITVHSRTNPDIEAPRHLPGRPGRNEDGLDINSCRNVRISNCRIWSDDDGIVLKSTSERPCKNVTITNCIVSANASGIKFGTESGGGFQKVTVSNCVIYDTRNSGVALETVDGGITEDITISNIVMENVKGSAIFIRLGNRGRPYKEKNPPVGELRNVIINNIQGTRIGGWIKPEDQRVVGCHVTGIPGYPVENVTLSNIRLSFKGGAGIEYAFKEIPEREDAYPSCRMFGTLPAYGFYCRHVKNIRFDNVELGFEHADHRQAMMFDDVQTVEIAGLNAQSLASTPSLIWFKDVQGAYVHSCWPTVPTEIFLRVDGKMSGDISLMDNNLVNVKQIYKAGEDVRKDILYLANNRTP